MAHCAALCILLTPSQQPQEIDAIEGIGFIFGVLLSLAPRIVPKTYRTLIEYLLHKSNFTDDVAVT